MLSPDTTCAEVEAVFARRTDARTLLLEVPGGIALIGRRDFFERLTGPLGFGRALYRRRPAHVLFGADDSFPADMAVEDAAMRLLSSPQTRRSGEVLVSLERGWGLVSEAELHAHLAEMHRRNIARIEWNERRLRALLENSAEFVAVLDADGTVRFRSSSPTARFSPVHQPILDYVHPDDAADVAVALHRVRNDPDIPVDGECRTSPEHGAVKRIEYRIQNLFDDPAVAGIVLNARDVTERRFLEDQLRHQALHDPLTGLANREQLNRRLDHLLGGLDRRRSVAVMFIDLDGFKPVNDGYGHGTGDAILVAMARRLQRAVRTPDLVARTGGDEFVVVVDGAAADEAIEVAGRLLDVLAAPVTVNGAVLELSASIGVAVTSDGPAGPLLLQQADVAMYTAKAAGRGRFVVYDVAEHGETLRSAHLGRALRGAIDCGELSLHYQPIVAVPSGEVEAVEALLRWHHPEHGAVGPDEFIPIAEAFGLMPAIGLWVLHEALEQLRRCDAAGRQQLKMSVNVSPLQLDDDTFTQAVEGRLRSTGLAPERLQLEITESAVATSGARAAAIRALHRLGVCLAIDDFGTGYSSLSSFGQLPFDVVKLDRSFLGDVTESPLREQLVRGVIELAHGLGYQVVAEGVEHPGQLDALAAMGCDAVQGYLLGRPAPGPTLDRPAAAGDRRHQTAGVASGSQ